MNAALRTAAVVCAILVALPLLAPRALASDADDAVVALLDEDFRAQMKANPLEASSRGLREYDDRLPDISAEAFRERTAGMADRYRRALDIRLEDLTEQNRVNLELLRFSLRDRLASSRFDTWRAPLTQQSGPHISLPQLPDTLSFTTRKHLEDYLARLRAMPAYLDQTIANMRTGLADRWTPPQIALRSVPDQISSLIGEALIEDPSEHLLYEPFLDLEEEDPLGESARATIRDEILPAFRRLYEFTRDEYVPACRESIAASSLPGGQQYYERRIEHFTTTPATARQIHELGLREVARIRSEMMDVIARSDFSRKDQLRGDDLFRAFIEHLRTDSRFYHDSPEALFTGYREICKRFDGEAPKLFRTLPRLTYGVREMPGFIARSAPTAYYYPGSLETGVAGFFVANTHRLDQRPIYEMIPLALHEASPGHHHQIALSQELEAEGLHEWRTTLGLTVFVEGWALYSERLGLEVGGEKPVPAGTPHETLRGTGFYEDPYADFGRLSYEMWRALRLVVDTGMHALGWSRQRAIDYMLENSALSEANVVSEVDRYIAWPGQALGYKIGELKIRELRARAEQALGEDFDVRAFHDVVLLAGAVPLETLERRVVEWIDSQTR